MAAKVSEGGTRRLDRARSFDRHLGARVGEVAEVVAVLLDDNLLSVAVQLVEAVRAHGHTGTEDEEEDDDRAAEAAECLRRAAPEDEKEGRHARQMESGP